MRRAAVVAALCVALAGGSVAVARPAVAQEEEKRSVGVVCIGRLIDLFLIDIPEETQMLAILVTDGFKCPSEGIG